MVVAKTLFEKYGGFSAFRKIVSTFYDEVLDSPTLQKYFVGVDMRRLIEHQTKFVTFVAGGPAHISDEQLATAHRGLGISREEFDQTLEIFIAALEDHDIEPEDIATLVQAVRNREHLIVGR